MRLSRPCYDKPHRCPGWAGGGMKYAKVSRCPKNGYVRVLKMDATKHFGYPTDFPWRFGHCMRCDVVTWPWVTRWLSPKGWWWSVAVKRWRWRLDEYLYNVGLKDN